MHFQSHHFAECFYFGAIDAGKPRTTIKSKFIFKAAEIRDAWQHDLCTHIVSTTEKKKQKKNQQIEKWMQFVESQLSIDRFHSTNRTNCVFINLLNACRISTPISFIFIFNYIFSSIFPIAYCCAIQEHVFFSAFSRFNYSIRSDLLLQHSSEPFAHA